MIGLTVTRREKRAVQLAAAEREQTSGRRVTMNDLVREQLAGWLAELVGVQDRAEAAAGGPEAPAGPGN